MTSLGTIIITILSIACLILLLIMALLDEDREWRAALAAYLFGWVACLALVVSLDNAEMIAKKNDIDFAIVEALSEITDHSNYDIVKALSVVGTDNLQSTFNLTDDEMIAFTVLTTKEEK